MREPALEPPCGGGHRVSRGGCLAQVRPHHRPPGASAYRRESGRRHRGEAGFSLVEALVGLTVLALVLTLSLAVTYRLPRHLERLEARRDALRTAELALESVRAGLVPMSPGRQPWPLTVPAPLRRELEAWIDVSATPTPDLYRIAVEVRYRSLGEPRDARFETLAWRP